MSGAYKMYKLRHKKNMSPSPTLILRFQFVNAVLQAAIKTSHIILAVWQNVKNLPRLIISQINIQEKSPGHGCGLHFLNELSSKHFALR